jgi:RNA polymerase sigma factor (sigma-70 family)
MEFEALYRRYARRLLSWASRRTRAPADAEDLAQDALLALYCSLPTYRGESGLDAFVFGVARNVWRVQARAGARLKRDGPRISLEEADPGELREERGPADELDARLSLERLAEEGPARLGAEAWAHLVEYALEVTDLEALERETGVSRAALKSRIARARRRLLEACPDALPR